LPVTASVSAGVVTVAARHYGLQGGVSTDVHIPLSASITPGIGTTVAVVQLGGVTAGAEGSTTTAANLATALAALEATGKYDIGSCIPATDDADTAWDNVAGTVNANKLPVADKRSAAFFGFRGSLADAATLALAQNNDRLHVLCQPGSKVGIPYLVGRALGVIALEESASASWNAAGASSPGLPAVADADRPTRTAVSSAISDGVTVIASSSTGSHFEALCTTKSKTANVDDDRALYAIKRSVADKFASDLQANWAVNFAQYNISSDILRRDGTPDTTQAPPAQTVTPRFAQGWVRNWVRGWHEAAGRRHLQNVEANIDQITVSRHSVLATRLAAYVPIAAVDPLLQTTFQIPEVGRLG
jgi:phage tail sheath gpL-like